MASVGQLDASDFPQAPKDIRKTLKARLVEVYPPRRDPFPWQCGPRPKGATPPAP